MMISAVIIALVVVTAGNATARTANNPTKNDPYKWNESGTIRLKRRYGSSEELGVSSNDEPVGFQSSPAPHGCSDVHTVPVEVGTIIGYPHAAIHDPGCRFLNVTVAAPESEDDKVTKHFMADLVEDESMLGRCPSISKIRVIPGKLAATGASCVIHAAHKECACDAHSCVAGHGAYTCIPVPAPLPREIGGCVALETHAAGHVHVDCVCGIRKALPGKDFHLGGAHRHHVHAGAHGHDEQKGLHGNELPIRFSHYRRSLVSFPIVLLKAKAEI